MQKSNISGETKRISVKGVPVHLWQKIKVEAIKKNVTIEKLITIILEDYIKKEEKKEQRRKK